VSDIPSNTTPAIHGCSIEDWLNQVKLKIAIKWLCSLFKCNLNFALHFAILHCRVFVILV